MADIITRSYSEDAKGSALTTEEMDTNWINLNKQLVEVEDSFAAISDNLDAFIGWNRPDSWLTLDTFDPLTQNVQLLLMIIDDGSTASNYIKFGVDADLWGDYVIDWGDGNSEIVDSDTYTTVEHYYDTTALTTPFISDGIRQVIITINGEPDYCGYMNSITSLTIFNSNMILEMNLCLPDATSITLNGNAKSLEKLALSAPNITSAYEMFRDSPNLAKIEYLDVSSATSINYMFYLCPKLIEVPTSINFSSATNSYFVFGDCTSLKIVNDIDFSVVESLSYLFNGCTNLKSVGTITTSVSDYCGGDISNLLSTEGMFYECKSLATAPLFTTSAVTNMREMFRYCYSLTTVPEYLTWGYPDCTSMFEDCISLLETPILSYDYISNAASMFRGCRSLTLANDMAFYNASSVSGMFYGCSSLLSYGTFIFDNTCTDFSGMFGGCYSLKEFTVFDTSNGTNIGNMFPAIRELPAFDQSNNTLFISYSNAEYRGLCRSQILYGNQSLNFINCNLSAQALNEIYNNLPTVTSQYLYVAGNPGLSHFDGHNPTIAANKGWVVDVIVKGELSADVALGASFDADVIPA